MVEKRDGKWLQPIQVKIRNLNKNLHAPSISSNNSIYDDGISIIPYQDGRYLEQKKIPGLSGMYPFVAPDESYLLFSSMNSHTKNADLFISFKDEHSNWHKGIPLSHEINSEKHEGNPFVTADGKYLFFSRGGDIYWVSAKIIEELRPEE